MSAMSSVLCLPLDTWILNEQPVEVTRVGLRPGMKVFHTLSTITAEVRGSRRNPQKLQGAHKSYVAVRWIGPRRKYHYAAWELVHLAIVPQ